MLGDHSYSVESCASLDDLRLHRIHDRFAEHGRHLGLNMI